MKLFGTLVLLTLSTVAAQAKVELPKELAASYEAQRMALVKGDWKAFFGVYDPSYVSVAPDGSKSEFAKFKKEVTAMCSGSNARNWKMTITGCKAEGDTVEVAYVANIDILFKEKTKSMRLREVGTDTWKKTAHGWKETKTVDKSFGPVK